jgi:hypothetical protein
MLGFWLVFFCTVLPAFPDSVGQSINLFLPSGPLPQENRPIFPVKTNFWNQNSIYQMSTQPDILAIIAEPLQLRENVAPNPDPAVEKSFFSFLGASI